MSRASLPRLGRTSAPAVTPVATSIVGGTPRGSMRHGQEDDASSSRATAASSWSIVDESRRWRARSSMPRAASSTLGGLDRAALRHRAREPVLGGRAPGRSSRRRPTRRARSSACSGASSTSTGFEAVPTEEVIREGKKVEEILKQIDEDEDIAVLVLGRLQGSRRPRPAGVLAGRRRHGRQVPDPHHHRARASWRSRTSRRWPEGESAGSKSGPICVSSQSGSDRLGSIY